MEHFCGSCFVGAAIVKDYIANCEINIIRTSAFDGAFSVTLKKNT